MMTARHLDNLRKMAEGESPFLQASLDGLADRAEIRRRLQTELEKHIRSKEGFDGLLDRIQKVTQYNASRAAAIAQTEKTRAVNGSRVSQAISDYLEQYEKARKQHRKRPALPRFQWVHTNAAKEPRRAHIAISGEIRAVGEEFLPGLKYPGDPDAPPSETIHCHCYVRRVREG